MRGELVGDFGCIVRGGDHVTARDVDPATFETYLDAGQTPREILAVGGGTKNKVWSQATSDVSGRTQVVRANTIGASYGDAFLAATAVGDVKRDAITAWNPVATTIEPDPAQSAVYGRQYAIFKDLYRQTKDLMLRIDG